MDNKSELDRLSEKIDLLQQKQNSAEISADKKNNDVGFGLALLSQFISALVVGVCVGMFLDKVFSTSHVFLIVFLVLGVSAGFLNCYRFEKLYNKKRCK